MTSVAIGGLFVGLVYGLLALGLVVTYRVSRIVNLGFGEIGMFAAMVYLTVRTGVTDSAYSAEGTDRGLLLPLLVALALGAVIGLAMEATVARPARRGGSTINGMIGTLAWGLFLLTLANYFYEADQKVTKPLVTGDGFELLGTRITNAQLLTLACAAVIVPGLGALYRWTTLGTQLRATAIDPYAASLCGVNVNRVSLVTWGLAGALSALSALLIASMAGSVSIFFMTVLALRAFSAALVGGLTSLWGGFLAGVGLGVAEAIIQYESPVEGITELVLALAVLALVLVAPRGLTRAQY